jgi:PAS domain S-box-containing protein
MKQRSAEIRVSVQTEASIQRKTFRDKSMKENQVPHFTDLITSKKVPLARWIWRSYFRTSLIPLLIVEVALILLYFISNAISNRENIQTLRTVAENNVTQTAISAAAGINHQLKSIAQATQFLRQQTTQVMTGKEKFERDDPSRFTYSKDGVFYTTHDAKNSAAVFYSGVTPISEKEREKAYRSAGLDRPYIGIQKSFPQIVQLYFNTFDSLNRIYPYFDVLTQYDPKMDIPSFNFYYEADLKHNPLRKVVWTDVYVDPAGQGWMISCIAPVYSGNFLEGVVGVDVKISTIINDVLDLKIPWGGYGLLVSRTGSVIALPKAGESDWGLNEVTSHHYSEAIKKDTFKPTNFNLFDRSSNVNLSKALRNQASGMMYANLNGKRIVSWTTVPETGWKLLITVPESNVYATSQSLANRFYKMAWLLVGGMLVFYIIFFYMLFYRAKKMSEFISQPLELIDNMVKNMAAGNYQQIEPDLPVVELCRTGQGIAKMGSQLDEAQKSRKLAEYAMMELSRKLQSVFDMSPDGFISIDNESEIVLVNPAFCRMTGSEINDWMGLQEKTLWKKLAKLAQLNSITIDQQSSFHLELLHPTKRVILCAIRSASQENTLSNGKVIYMHDITREVEVDRMKNQFLATAAHELRTPLTSVMGYSELLINQMVPKEMQQEALQKIFDQSKWLVKIVNELLNLSTIEGKGAADFNFKNYPVDLLLIQTLSMFQNPPHRSPPFCHTLAGIYISVDAEKFKTALLNVLDNAYKFSTDGKVHMLMVQDVVDGVARVGVKIEDNGRGMTDGQLEHIFDRFWRADSSGSIPGTGLGMSITHEIIQLLGGSIEIKSLPNKGSSVILWLPQNQLQS